MSVDLKTHIEKLYGKTLQGNDYWLALHTYMTEAKQGANDLKQRVHDAKQQRDIVRQNETKGNQLPENSFKQWITGFYLPTIQSDISMLSRKRSRSIFLARRMSSTRTTVSHE